MSFDLHWFQEDHERWVEHNFPGQHTNENRHQAFLGVVEEMGELAHHMLKFEQSIRSYGLPRSTAAHNAAITPQLRIELADGVGDLVIFLAGFCDMYGLNLEQCIAETWQKVRQRDWIAFPKNGMTE